MERTAFLAIGMICLIVVGFVAESEARKLCEHTSIRRRFIRVCKRDKIKKKTAEFAENLPDEKFIR